MNTSNPPGERSGEGTAGLWDLISDDDRRKGPGATEAAGAANAQADREQVRGDAPRRVESDKPR